jgi:DNA polymerase (family 10)
MDEDTSYTDEKGRTRWRRNDEVAGLLKELADYLIVGGYEPSHAARYPKLAYAVSRMPESVVALHREGRLREIPGVGETVAGIIGELIETGASRKTRESGDGFDPPPLSVLEMTRLPGLGALTVRRLYAEYGIDSLGALRDALDAGLLDDFRGLGPKLREAVRAAA